MSNKIVSEICIICGRILKPIVYLVEGESKIKLGCRYCEKKKMKDEEKEEIGKEEISEPTSDEICKYCKKPMVLVKNGKRNLFDENTWIYECHNIDCDVQPKLVVDVCEECERESIYWDE